jgi:hypothetical protein
MGAARMIANFLSSQRTGYWFDACLGATMLFFML